MPPKPAKIPETALSCLVHCTADNTFLLSEEANSGRFWFTSGTNNTDEWRPFVTKTMKENLNIDVSECDLVKLYKFCIPDGRTANHYIFKVPLTADQKKRIQFNTKSKKKFKWCTPLEIEQLVTQAALRSLEVVECVSKLIGSMIPTTKPIYVDIYQRPDGTWDEILCASPLHAAIEVFERHIVVRVEGSNLNPYEQLVAAAAFRKPEQLSIYQYFLTLCFPCMYMNIDIFTTVCILLGWNKNDAPHLFRAANLYNTSLLSFRDFLYVISACEPSLQHGGSAAEVRCRLIFRYYDKSNDKLLSFDEFKDMIADIRTGWGLTNENPVLTKEAEGIIRGLGLGTNAALHINDFLLCTGNLSLRGTSFLLRSKKSILTVISESGITTKSIAKETAPVASTSAKTPARAAGKLDRNACFELALHSVKIKYGTTDMDVDQLWYYDQEEITDKKAKSKKSKVSESTQFSRMLSVDSFNKKSLANEFLTLLRDWVRETSDGTKKQIPDLLRSNKTNVKEYGTNLISLCDKVRDICKNEQRLVQIQSPVFILGDLHGNFLDLIYFEKMLWSLGPTLTPGCWLFLGDYVDRGAYSVEVVTFLFSYKLLNPNKTRLIRGNHEIRNIQKAFTFYKECCFKFGDELGSDVWEAVNKVFDCLPVAAVVDSKIFCCHGGIPPPWLCPEVSAINTIPVPLQKPEQQSALAWEIMWNDPVKEQKMSEQANLELMSNDGFAANTYRGTAHVFSIDALQHFLMVNNFSHVIRAHEVQRSGFLAQQKGKLITVFSSSGYSGGSNEAAVVLAEARKLRVFRLNSTAPT